MIKAAPGESPDSYSRKLWMEHRVIVAGMKKATYPSA
jgi:hypothetical protein